MSITMFRAKLRKGQVGKFRRLKVGEMIEAHDVVVGPSFFDWIAEGCVGLACEKRDTIMRLEFDK